VLLIVSAVSAALLLLTGYLLEQSRSEVRIANSEQQATSAYYLAEAGANEAIYKLKNDATWKSKFLTGTFTNETFSRSNLFGGTGGYTVTAESSGNALVDITVTATLSAGGQQSRRVIKTRFTRATNPANTWEQSIFGGDTSTQQNGNVTVSRNCTVNGGTLQANQNFKVTNHATLTVNDAAVQANNNIIVNGGGSLVLNNSTQTEGVPALAMPQIDFDSSSATSLKNRANQVYTSAQFAALPSGTTLNGVTYVAGNANWSNKNLTIAGILAASGDISITLTSGYSLTINAGDPQNGGSGLLGKNNITATVTGGNLTINGLVYAVKDLNIVAKSTPTVAITGGVLGFHLNVGDNDTSGSCSITYDAPLASSPLDPALNGNESPIIQVNHWEEEY
jgi:hypothetical protein